MKHFPATLALAILVVNSCWGADIKLPPKGKISSDGLSLASKREKSPKVESALDFLSKLKDEDVFISVEGGDSLTWRSIWAWIEESVKRVEARADMREEGTQAMRNMVLEKELTKNLRSFLHYALLAKEAKKLGLSADPEKIKEVRERWLDTYRKSGELGAAKLRAASEPDSFFEHAVTNSVLWQTYADKIVLPGLKISDEEIAARNDLQRKRIADAVATNAAKRVLAYEILSKVKYAAPAERIGFAEAAAKWTEDYNGDTGGVFADDDNQPRDITSGEVIKQVEAAYRKLQPGEISDVVETPYSWHIVRLINRNFNDEGEEESVHLAHIMLEKVPLPPVLTVEQIRHKLTNRKMRIAMEERYVELLKGEKINCIIPLFEKEDRVSKRVLKKMRKEEK